MDTVTQYISAASQQLVASPEALLNSAAQAVEEGILVYYMNFLLLLIAAVSGAWSQKFIYIQYII